MIYGNTVCVRVSGRCVCGWRGSCNCKAERHRHSVASNKTSQASPSVQTTRGLRALGQMKEKTQSSKYTRGRHSKMLGASPWLMLKVMSAFQRACVSPVKPTHVGTKAAAVAVVKHPANKHSSIGLALAETICSGVVWSLKMTKRAYGSGSGIRCVPGWAW